MAALQRLSFAAMGTEVDLLVDAPASTRVSDGLDAARAEVLRLEGLLSRFRADSALSELNRCGEAVLDRDTFAVVRLAVEARAQTGGRFDPTVHDALVACGYDRDIAGVRSVGSGAVGRPVPGSGAIGIDVATRKVVLGDGVRIDLGGIAKGFAADRVCAALPEVGPCLASIGGDLAVSGPRRDGTPWPVAVEDGPTLALGAGGMATSGVDRRRWTRDGRDLHHIIDPATGTSAATDLLRVTVVAATATRAEILATELMLDGVDRAHARADASGIPAVLVPVAGPVRLVGVSAAAADPMRSAA